MSATLDACFIPSSTASADTPADVHLPGQVHPGPCLVPGPASTATTATLAPRAPLELTGHRRDDARLLVAERSGQRSTEARMADLTRFLNVGDVLVVNTSGTLPAAIPVDDMLVVHLSTELEPARRRAPGSHSEGGHVESAWVVELRNIAGHGSTPRLGYRPSAPIDLPGGAVLAILGAYTPDGRNEVPERTRLWTARLSVPEARKAPYHLRASTFGRPQVPHAADVEPGPGTTHPVSDNQTGSESAARDGLLDYLAHYGRPIRYGTDAQPWPLSTYQTVFAVEPGSAEMPSAGRGFTAELVTDLVSHGVTVAPIVLHTGVASQEAGEMPYPEQYRVPPATAAAVNAARASGRRVIAVGTTATRAIETVADRHGHVTPGRGWTDLVITPQRGLRAINGLLTGWHDPEASHLMLVEAVAGREVLDRSYEAAVAAGFAGHEFGDFHLILP